ncbi:hypothetical protein ACS0TY_019302 [Phlomoides rotata]
MAPNSTPHHSGNPSTKFTKQGRMMIPPKDLNIVWGKDNRYWSVPQNQGSPAELHQVSWLEVTGSVGETSPNKKYEVGFRVSLNPDAFGWGKYPMYIMIKRGKQGKAASTKINMNPNLKGEFEISGKLDKSKEQSRGGSDDARLYFGLYEVWSGKWKGGLKIHHAFITEFP